MTTTTPIRVPSAQAGLLGYTEIDEHRGLTIALVVSLVAAAALAVYGLPPVGLHGPNHYAGLMAPTCGMTRAVRFLLIGDAAAAWRYNPAVFVLGAVGAAGVTRTAAGVLLGRWWQPRLAHRGPAVLFAVVAVLVLWANQQAHAELLVGP